MLGKKSRAEMLKEWLEEEQLVKVYHELSIAHEKLYLDYKNLGLWNRGKPLIVSIVSRGA